MRTDLLRSLTLGLSLAASTLASASPGRAPVAESALAAQRQAMTQHMAMYNHLVTISTNPNFAVLQQHRTQVVDLKHFGTPQPPMVFAQKGGTTLQLQHQNLSFIAENGASNLTVEHAAQMGITSPKALDRLIAKKLLEVARVEGDPGDEAAVTRARGVLQAEIADAAAVMALAHDMGTHPDVKLTIDFLPTARGTLRGKTLRIASDDVHHLEVRQITTRQPGYGNTNQVPKLGLHVVQTANPNAYSQAQLHDLHRLGVGTKPELELAIDHAIVGLFAPEDLPLHDQQ